MHSPVWVSLAHDPTQSRSAASGSCGACRELVRRLRRLWRGCTRGCSVPVFLSRTARVQSDAVGALAEHRAQLGHSTAATTCGSTQRFRAIVKGLSIGLFGRLIAYAQWAACGSSCRDRVVAVAVAPARRRGEERLDRHFTNVAVEEPKRKRQEPYVHDATPSSRR